MGKINQGILEGVSGTVGSVVGANWKGISYLRGKATSHNDANTESNDILRIVAVCGDNAVAITPAGVTRSDALCI
ncbi:MAG: hypothetical protein KA807_10135 [Prolixibacteraceae bacterium]|nr:hypothetical protein [Prolixibacteraceae bacterium]